MLLTACCSVLRPEAYSILKHTGSCDLQHPAAYSILQHMATRSCSTITRHNMFWLLRAAKQAPTPVYLGLWDADDRACCYPDSHHRIHVSPRRSSCTCISRCARAPHDHHAYTYPHLHVPHVTTVHTPTHMRMRPTRLPCIRIYTGTFMRARLR